MPSGVPAEGKDFLLNSIFGKTTTIPGTLYLALLTAEPTLDSTGSTLAEPSGGAYARASFANSNVTWGTSVNGLIRNIASITFPEATADWGSINWYAICTAATNGTALLWGELTVSRYVVSGTAPIFDPDTLSITADAVQPSIIA